jgi:hypothetical protein
MKKMQVYFKFCGTPINRDILKSQHSLSGLLEFREPLSRPHEAIEFQPERGIIDPYFEYVFEQTMDSKRLDNKPEHCSKKNMFAFMTTLKTYLEIFSMQVYKYSLFTEESRNIFETFFEMKYRFSDKNNFIKLISYCDDPEDNEKLFYCKNLYNLIIKIVPLSSDDSNKTIYMLFSIKVNGNTLIHDIFPISK